MLEPEETYVLTFTSWVGTEEVDQQILERGIQANTTHTTSVSLEAGDLTIGRTVVEGDTQEERKLPRWFTSNLPFLTPIANPLLKIVPADLVPYVPYIPAAIPLILVALVVAIVRKRRGRRIDGGKEG